MNTIQDGLSVTDRLQGPTSKFFKPLVTGGIIVAALSAALVAGQGSLAENGVAVPALLAKLIEVVGYLAAGVAAASKLTVDFSALKTGK